MGKEGKRDLVFQSGQEGVDGPLMVFCAVLATLCVGRVLRPAKRNDATRKSKTPSHPLLFPSSIFHLASLSKERERESRFSLFSLFGEQDPTDKQPLNLLPVHSACQHTVHDILTSSFHPSTHPYSSLVFLLRATKRERERERKRSCS